MMSEATCRALVSERSGGMCEMRWEGCRGVGESMHHRRKRSQGGAWTPANILHACGDGTTGCHGFTEANPVSAKRRGIWLYASQHPLLTPVQMVFRGLTGPYLLDDEGSVQWLSKRALERILGNH